jgi:magnesium-transporting ATPase (P-type)
LAAITSMCQFIANATCGLSSQKFSPLRHLTFLSLAFTVPTPALTHRWSERGGDGFRALGVAWRELEPDRARAAVADEQELVFAGFVVFFDPPKESAGAAIAALGAKGIAVKILSGDNERVTQPVCAELAIPITGVLTGTEIEALSDEALAARLEETNLFCRVTPGQKNRVILGLRHRGHVVGFLGDGINDAPSLRSSDVGIFSRWRGRCRQGRRRHHFAAAGSRRVGARRH